MQASLVKTFVTKCINRLSIVIGISLCGNLLFGQNSLSLDYFKRINPWPIGARGFAKGANDFIFCGGIDTPGVSVTGCANNDSTHALLICTDENANMKWAHCYAGNGSFFFTRFGENGTIWAAGYFDSIVGVPHLDTFEWGPGVVKFDSLGTPLWYGYYGSFRGDDEFTDFKSTSDGGVIFAQSFNYAGNDIAYKYGSDPFNYDIWICKLDSIGRIQWNLTLGGSGNQGTATIKELVHGIYTVLVNTNSIDYMLNGINYDSINYEPWLLEIDTGGHVLSSKIVSTFTNTPVYSAFQSFEMPIDRIVVVGEANLANSAACQPGIGNLDFLVVSADTGYNYQWCTYNGGTQDDYELYSCTVNDSLIIGGGYSASHDGDLTRCSSYTTSSENVWFGLYNMNQRKKVWQQCLCGSNSDFVNGLIYDSAENAVYVMVTGGSSDGDFTGLSLPNGGGVYLLKYTPITTGTNDIANEKAQIKLYPNPANDLCNLQIAGANKTFSASITDVTGREIKTLFSNQLVTNFGFSVENFPSGIYCLRISDEQGNQVVKKLVVQ